MLGEKPQNYLWNSGVTYLEVKNRLMFENI
jgi:hypothetical protein